MNGAPDPGALNIILDLYVYPQATPMGNSTITLEGISPNTSLQCAEFRGRYDATIRWHGTWIAASKSGPSGADLAGRVFQVFANWVGTQLNLNFVITPSPYTITNPGNIVLNWRAGTPLATALTNTLQVAYPNATVRVNISNIVLSHDEIHKCPTLTGLAQLLSDITTTSLNIYANGNVITVADISYQPTPKTLSFLDFVGQPMWIEVNKIQIVTVLRPDIQVTDIIMMPEGFAQHARVCSANCSIMAVVHQL